MGTFRYVGLPVLLNKAQSARDRAVATGAEELRARAEEYAPKDTLTLSGGIAAEIDGATATVSTTTETNPGQAVYEEVGSIHNPANEYMQRAVLDASIAFVETLARETRAEF